MSSKKITDLTSYSAAEAKAAGGADLLFITDVAHQETKKITALEFSKYATGIGGSYTGSFTGSFTGSLLGTASWAISSSYANTASYALNSDNTVAANVGNQGAGVFKQKTGNTIQLKNISAGTNVQLLDDTVNDCIQINATSTLTQPGGPRYAVQYNNPGGTFTGDSDFLYQPSVLTTPSSLTINGKITSLFTASNLSGIGFYGTASWATSSVSSSYSFSGSYALTSSYAGTASYLANQTQTGLLTSYSVIDTTAATTNVVYPTLYTGISKTVTPKTATSKFIIHVSVTITVYNGTGWGYGSLYKDGTLLVDKFVWSDNGITYGGSLTYIDTATDLSSRTYSVKYTTSGGDTIYINSIGGSFTIPATLSILESTT